AASIRFDGQVNVPSVVVHTDDPGGPNDAMLQRVLTGFGSEVEGGIGHSNRIRFGGLADGGKDESRRDNHSRERGNGLQHVNSPFATRELGNFRGRFSRAAEVLCASDATESRAAR